MIVTENTSERLVIVEAIPAAGFALTWVSPLRLTLRLMGLKTPGIRELASQVVRQARSTRALSRPLDYPNLRRMPLGLGYLLVLWKRFHAERELVVDYPGQQILQTERGLFTQLQKTIDFSQVDSLLIEKKQLWKGETPTDIYRLLVKVQGKPLLFFEHMDKGRVEELLRGLVSRMQLT